MKITPIDPEIVVPRARYSNKGVTLKLATHSERVRGLERQACLDYWHSTGAFKSIKVDNLVMQSSGTLLLWLNQTDVNIEVIEDNQWQDWPSGVRHSHVDYWMTYSYAGYVMDLVGDATQPQDIEKIPTGIVPGNTDWS